jgi:hypothetical protein
VILVQECRVCDRSGFHNISGTDVKNKGSSKTIAYDKTVISLLYLKVGGEDIPTVQYCVFAFPVTILIPASVSKQFGHTIFFDYSINPFRRSGLCSGQARREPAFPIEIRLLTGELDGVSFKIVQCDDQVP